jgi:predicted transcriptional regulator
MAGRKYTGAAPRILPKVRAEIACFLSREMGILMAEIARRLGTGASGVAIAIRRKNC